MKNKIKELRNFYYVFISCFQFVFQIMVQYSLQQVYQKKGQGFDQEFLSRILHPYFTPYFTHLFYILILRHFYEYELSVKISVLDPDPNSICLLLINHGFDQWMIFVI